MDWSMDNLTKLEQTRARLTHFLTVDGLSCGQADIFSLWSHDTLPGSSKYTGDTVFYAALNKTASYTVGSVLHDKMEARRPLSSPVPRKALSLARCAECSKLKPTAVWRIIFRYYTRGSPLLVCCN